MKIRVETNGLPNQCYYSETHTPSAQDFAFEMYFSPYGTTFEIQQFPDQTSMDLQLCTSDWATSSTVNAQIDLEDESSSNTDRVVGISLIGVPFYTGTYEDGYDFMRPQAYGNLLIPTGLEVDNCLGSAYNGVYRFHSYSHCIFTTPSIRSRKCSDIYACSQNPINYALT